jgi:predicted dehydrogenase
MTEQTHVQPQPLEAVLLGAGNRGRDVFGRFALLHPEELKFVAVADADQGKRERFALEHGIPPERCFARWEDLLGQPRLVPALFNALPDALHEESALRALEARYHVMLEKPVASTLRGSRRVANAAQASGAVVMLGYVLRYTPFFTTMRRIVESGALGRIVTIEWRENVSSAHYAHSYVRGNWARLAQSSPMILAKCSHDLDMIGWVTGLRVSRLASFGNLLYFRSENAPEGAPERCHQGCPVESNCEFSALRVYLGDHTGWPVSTITTDLTLEGRRRALEAGPYGRCVYRAGNDVVDHQVVALDFDSGASGTLSMHGHSAEEGRAIRIDGTRATLRGVFKSSKQEIRLEPHTLSAMNEGGGEIVPISAPAGITGGGHGGGDDGLVAAFIRAVRDGTRESVQEYMESHELAFAIEQSRLRGCVVEMNAFRQDAQNHT